MADITLDEILRIDKNLMDNPDDRQAQLAVNALVQEWATHSRDLEDTSDDISQALYDLISKVDNANIANLAVKRWNEDMPQNNSRQDENVDTEGNNNRTQSDNSVYRWRYGYLRGNNNTVANADNIELAFASRTLKIYRDMGLISDSEFNRAVSSRNVYVVDEALARVTELNPAQELNFAERFVRDVYNDVKNIDTVVPVILANAYRSLKLKAQKNTANAQDRGLLEVVRARIDSLSNQFAMFNGNSTTPAIEGQGLVFNFVDTTNIADSFDGYDKMFKARLEDFPDNSADPMRNVLESNRRKAIDVIRQYDKAWGLDEAGKTSIDSIENRWDDLNKAVNGIAIDGNIMGLVSRYQFLDANGRPLAQFVDANNNPKLNFERGDRIIADGRLNQVIDLARQDVIKSHLAKTGQRIDIDGLSKEFNDRILTKLFEIDTADKIRRGVLENPEQFTEPRFRTQFLDELANAGGAISDEGFAAAMQAQVNQTAGFAARLKSLVKNGSAKSGAFCEKLFKPLEKIDKRKDARFNTVDDKSGSANSKRIELFKRILKGFASAFLVSAALTTIATAAAATAGVSLAVSMAAVGVITALGVSYMQIQKWRRNQRANGQPDDFRALLRDKRMLVSLGTTGIAAFAMCFGAAGFAEAAQALGYGALAVGGSSNALQSFKDARNSGLGRAESVVWAVANAAAVVVGGIAGRTTAQSAINAFNQSNPENTLFQQERHTQEASEITHTRTESGYTPDALERARTIAEQWYADNPAELQHRVDLINDYNAVHGTNIDPYRAIMINGDAGGQTFDNMALQADDAGNIMHSHGNHKVFGADWLNNHSDFTSADIRQAANLFGPNGINSDAMDIVQRLDSFVSSHNEVGAVLSGDRPLYDTRLMHNYTGADGRTGFDTYVDGNNPFETVSVSETEIVYNDVTNYEPVDVPAMGMFGQFFPEIHKKVKNLRNRVGSFFDKVFKKKPEETKPIEPDDEDENKLLPPVEDDKDKNKKDDEPKDDIHLLPWDEDKGELLPPAIIDDGKDKNKDDDRITDNSRLLPWDEGKGKDEPLWGVPDWFIEKIKKDEEENKKKTEEEKAKKEAEAKHKKAEEKSSKSTKAAESKVYDCGRQKTIKNVDLSGYTHFRNFDNAEIVFRNVKGLKDVISFEAGIVNGKPTRISVHIAMSDVSNIAGYRGIESLDLAVVKVHGIQSLDFGDTKFVTVRQTDLSGINKFIGYGTVKIEQAVTGLKDVLYFGSNIKEIDLSNADLSEVNTIYGPVMPKLPDNWQGILVIDGKRVVRGISAKTSKTKNVAGKSAAASPRKKTSKKRTSKDIEALRFGHAENDIELDEEEGAGFYSQYVSALEDEMKKLKSASALMKKKIKELDEKILKGRTNPGNGL